MGRCQNCGDSSPKISNFLSLCKVCLEKTPPQVFQKIHARTRGKYGLPPTVPKSEEGIRCGQCVNNCQIGTGERGYCGLVTNIGGKLERYKEQGFLDFYFDPLPTNCVADWVCPGGSGAGFPKYAYKDGPEYGYKNLAVFFRHCSFNCLFCQNWHFKEPTSHFYSVERLLGVIDETTSCICYFGGDPTPNILYSLNLSERILTKVKRIFRICWETNGSASRGYIKRMMELSLISGGNLKIDLKAFSRKVSFALCGVENKNTISNIEFCASFFSQREVPPPLVVSTLLVPGYIDEKELREMARFLSGIGKKIPWTLLVFAPHFYLSDLPITPRVFVEGALEIAKEYGMERVRIGNFHLLTPSDKL